MGGQGFTGPSKGRGRPGINSTIIYVDPVKMDHVTESTCGCDEVMELGGVCALHLSARELDRRDINGFLARHNERLERERATQR